MKGWEKEYLMLDQWWINICIAPISHIISIMEKYRIRVNLKLKVRN